MFEKGIVYIFESEGKWMVGSYIGSYPSDENDIHLLKSLEDGKIENSTNIFDKFNSINVNDFMEDIARELQNKLKRNVSVTHTENYEFNITIPDYGLNTLEEFEYCINTVLEDWWSVQLEQLEYIIIKNREHGFIANINIDEIHKLQFKY